MKVGLLGFGLIGGSLARALRASDDAAGWPVTAWSPSGEGPRAAADAGLIERAARDPQEVLVGADLLVIAAPALDSLDLLERLAGPWRTSLRSDATVTDVVSSKGAIVERANALELRFVGGHPMAGRESSGFDSADPELFVDRPWVVVAGAQAGPSDMERVESMARAVGARPIRMSAGPHDEAVAGVSHLPLVLSAALVEAVAGDPGWREAAALAATGWAGMTRLARGDVEMGTGMLATNAPALAERLRRTRDVLDRWLEALEGTDGPDVEALRGRLGAARDRLESPTDG